MPKPRQRSRSLRRIKKKVPGGRLSIRYEKRKPKGASCGNCGVKLKGIIRELPYKMRDVAKSIKTVARPYGGNLCSGCSREVLKDKARLEVK